jgi:serine/threonine-protein kinase
VGIDSKICTTCGRRFGDEALFCPRDGTALTNASSGGQRDPFLGREILGHIEIRSLIGSGAMGRVYRAHQRGIDRDVAVKILHRDLAQNPDLVVRFLREAKVASRLNHPNVVQVLLAGQLEDGTMYLVMEFLDGISLHSALLATGGQMPLLRAMHIGLQVCDAVGQAHEAGVVHRDVKPENIMLVKRGDDLDFVKVLDFGIARFASSDANRSGVETQAGLVFGTARYLSPEGARGEHVAPASDCYAIATVLYQALSGRTPFESDSSVSLLVAQIHDPAPPLRSQPRAGEVPIAIEAAIMRNLAKDPRQRDPDAHAFGRALLDAAVQAGLSQDDLLHRPAVARKRGTPSVLPASTPSVPSKVLAATGPVVPANLPRTPLASTQTELAPAKIPDGLYHPSYSGRVPGPGSHEGERRVAKTIDEDAEAPLPPPPQPPTPLGAGTVAMPMPLPPPEESILGTASTPREEALTPAGVPRRGRVAAALVIVGLLGVSALGIGAYRMGWIPGVAKVDPKQAEIESLVTRARAAVDAHHWEEPKEENVVELTDKLIALAPTDQRGFRIRKVASDRIVRDALERKANHDVAGALHLFELAAKLSPPDKGLNDEIAEAKSEVEKESGDGGVSKFAPTLDLGGKDAARVGESVTFTVTFTEPIKDSDPKAHFAINGPGVKDKTVAAKAETPQKYTATFTFPQAGSYHVHFFALVEGSAVKVESDRPVVAANTPKPPAPSTSGTWPTKPVGSWPTKPVGTGATGPDKTLTPDPIPLPAPTSAPPPPAPPLPKPF